MLSILGNRKIIVSILTMAFLIVGVQGMSYGQAELNLSASTPTFALPGNQNVVDPGGEFIISVSVTNSGNAPSSVTALIFYDNRTTATTTGGAAVGAAVVPVINAGQSIDIRSSPLTAPASMGTYYYYASVLSNDANANNNTSRSAALRVQDTPKPDLQVISLYSTSYQDPNTGVYNTAVSGGNFTLQANVQNLGNAEFTGQFNLEYHYSTFRLSPASVPRWTPTRVPIQITTSIPAGTSRTVPVNLPAPFGVNTIGIYYYYVRVTPADGVSTEARNPPNVSIAIRTASADLAFDSVTVDKSTLGPSESFTLTVPVKNQGSGPSSNRTTLQYYRSTDSGLDRTTDTQEGSPVTIGVLAYQGATGDTRTETVTLTAQDTPGTYYYGAYVNDPTNEPNANIGNNYSNAVAITVTAPPDLVADLFQLRPDTVAPGARLTLDATVRNDGEGRSQTTTLRLYESDNTRAGNEVEIRRVFIDELDSGRSASERIPMTAPTTPGTYYYRVHVNQVENEEVTRNNWSNYIELYVEEPLVIESLQPSQSTLASRESFTLTATVRNDGTTTSARTAVEFYSSADNTITSRDTSIGRESVSAIAARGTSQVSRTLTAPNTPGTYYYGACIGDSTGSCEVVRITVVEQTIVANLERPPIYWVNSDGGSLQNLTRSEVEPFVRNVRNANSIAVDREGGKVYWTEELGTNRGRVRRANLNGTNIELVRELPNLPRGIAIDPSKGKLYVTNVRGNIHKMNLDGTLFHWNFIVDLTSPGGIAVDAAGGKVYWTEDTGNERGRVRRANLNGTNIEPVRTLASVPRGIAIDPSKGKLYVPNARGNIHKMNLDGTLFHWDFITGLDSPQGVAVDAAAGKLYWTEAGKIRRANLNGRNLEDVATGIRAPAGIALSVAPVSMEAPAAPSAAAVASDATALHANYPNPFNPETWIPYQLQTAADVTVTIHDIRGMIVRELSLGHQPAGVYQSRSRAAYWDGRNKLGEPVASGLYFYTLTAGDFTATRKMLIRK